MSGRGDAPPATASATPRPASGRPRLWPLGTALVLAVLYAAFRFEYASRVQTGLGPEPLPEALVLAGDHPRPWQFLTYAFVHADAGHVKGNASVIALAGALAEQRLGAPRTVAAFALAAIAVGVGFHFASGDDLYGASGAASALVALAAVLAFTAPRRHPALRAAPLVGALAYVYATEVGPALAGHPSPGAKPHAIGYAFGAALGLVLARKPGWMPAR